MWKNNSKIRFVAFILSTILILTGLGACEQISTITDVIAQDIPSADDTYTSLLEISRAMEDAMSHGETEITFNATGIDENDLQHIGENLSTFWGRPVRYSINSEFEELEGIVPGETVDVKTITNSFDLSDNYYVWDFIKNGIPIPENETRAKAIASELPTIAATVFANEAASSYDKVLSAHDWVVANIEYLDISPSSSDEQNSSYGAIIDRNTMCQGYAEAFELLLKCYTDIDVVQIVGEALNISAENPAPEPIEDAGQGVDNNEITDQETDETLAPEPVIAEPEVISELAVWGGHAWCAVRLNDLWYQIDPTFDDPKGNPAGQVSHFYFGQNDEVMRKNHRWNSEYFPISDSEDFLYYRQNGLYANNWDEFQAIVTNMLAENPISSFEAAIAGATIDEDNIQFIYQVRDDIDMIRWSEQIWEDIYVQSIEVYYS